MTTTRQPATHPHTLRETIGARIRQLRQERGVTLMKLAALTKIDLATLSRIETGHMSGTLESHFKIATTLGVKLPDLYAGIEAARTKDAVIVQRPAQRSEIYVHAPGKATVTMLTTDILKKNSMPVLMTLEPGGATQHEECRVGVEKFLYVLEGTLEATIGEQTHQLKRGTSLYFDASLPHRLRNTTTSPAKCLMVTTPPVL